MEVGERFGNLVVESRAALAKNGETRWLFRCDCGGFTITLGYKVKNGRTKSCGCRRKLSRRKYAPIISSARKVWGNTYNDGINFEDFFDLSQLPCHYCGTPPSNAFKGKHGALFIYNGLDRIDSSRDHSIDNVVPCCSYCNTVKLDKSIDEFLTHIERIYHHTRSMRYPE